jgi:FtsP/CotA-like multicopper oxidase with cupredoxin domain
MQVASGAAGALLVEGGVDELPEIKAAEEKVLFFQQIPYDKTGKVESFDESFGPNQWQDLKRYTTINGEVQPLILMQAGAVQRWRMIHAAFARPCRWA